MPEPGYLDLQLPDAANADVKRARAIAALTDGQSDYQPQPADPEYRLLDGTAEMAAEGEQRMSDAGRGIFRAFFRALGLLDPIVSQAATATVTLTARPTAPAFTLPAGTELALDDAAFETVVDVDVPAGGHADDVRVVCLKTGTAGNVPGARAGLLDATYGAWIASVAVTVAPTDGQDAESDDVFLGRARRRAKRFGRPTLPTDFALLAIDLHPEVDSAIGLDGYLPARDGEPEQLDAEDAVTVCLFNAAGFPVSSSARSTVEVGLATEREGGFKTAAIDAVYTLIAASAVIELWPGWAQAGVRAACLAALDKLLSPATFGLPPTTQDGVRYLEVVVYLEDVIGALKAVDGVRHVHDVRLNGLEQDVVLQGIVGVPQPGAHQIAFRT